MLIGRYHANMKLSGVIYLHEISQTRMLGTARKNLDMFNKLVGQEATKNVVLATTKWSDVPLELGEKREHQLRDRHWTYMVDLGANLRRFSGEGESGWDIIRYILQRVELLDVDAIEIQQELVEIDKVLPDTEAGRTLRYTLEELLATQRNAVAQLKNDDSNSIVKERIHESNQKIRQLMKQLGDLNVPAAQRVLGWLKKRIPGIHHDDNTT